MFVLTQHNEPLPQHGPEEEVESGCFLGWNKLFLSWPQTQSERRSLNTSLLKFMDESSFALHSTTNETWVGATPRHHRQAA